MKKSRFTEDGMDAPDSGGDGSRRIHHIRESDHAISSRR